MSNRFRFQASAVGAAGRITVPFQEQIEVQASLALPAIGGYGSAVSSDFHYRQILSFRSATSVVTGSETGPAESPSYDTLVNSTVTGLNVMGMVTADLVVANLVETYKNGLHTFKLIGTRFENLRIAGIPVEVDLASDVFDKYDNHEDLLEAYRTEDTVRTLLEDITLKDRLQEAPDKISRWFSKPTDNDSAGMSATGRTLLSLVRKLEPKTSAIQAWGHVIHVDGFGTIRLAELEVGPSTRRVNMVQIDLGCPVEGRVSACSIIGDGSDG